MSKSAFMILILIALFALAGCSEYTFGGPGSEVELIENERVEFELRYLDNNDEGPRYDVALTLPDEWVGSMETLNRGNSVTFRYLDDDQEDDEEGEPLFYIEALSNAQYWEQIGSYPGQFYSFKNTSDTYFIYHFPIDPYYSGLEEAQFDAFVDMLPDVFASAEVNRIQEDAPLVSVQQ